MSSMPLYPVSPSQLHNDPLPPFPKSSELDFQNLVCGICPGYTTRLNGQRVLPQQEIAREDSHKRMILFSRLASS